MDGCKHTCRVCASLSDPKMPDRFWAKVDTSGSCWLWRAQRNPKGYGRFDIGGTPAYAHRVAYELINGPIPDGLEVDHLCWNPSCVNPEHLRAVSPQTNQLNRKDRTSAFPDDPRSS